MFTILRKLRKIWEILMEMPQKSVVLTIVNITRNFHSANTTLLLYSGTKNSRS
jgi:hypothetical protein